MHLFVKKYKSISIDSFRMFTDCFNIEKSLHPVHAVRYIFSGSTLSWRLTNIEVYKMK